MNEPQPLVLVVDDNATNLDLLVNTLKGEYRLGIAKKGSNAVEYAAKYHPDLILLDIMMPGMDGFEVCRRLRMMDAIKSVPVIFLSAKDKDTNIETGLEAGGTDYITKPFHETILLARIRAHVERGYDMRKYQNCEELI